MAHGTGYTINSRTEPFYRQYLLGQGLAAIGDVCIVDQQGKYFFISDTYAQRQGIDPDEAIGHPVAEVLGPASQIPEILKTGKPIRESLFRHNDTVSLINRFPIKDGNTTVGVIGYALSTDTKMVTELQDRLDDAIRELNYYKQKAFHENSVASLIITQNVLMQRLTEHISMVAKTRSSVLITGESGTGKEVVANAIHRLSPRRDKPFIKINCAAIPDNLLESELFGYEGGAFTGALKGGKIGDFEAANNGTLFLDEVDSLTPRMQSKLLRAIQEREIKRVGSTKPIPIDVRYIFATNKDLLSMVREGAFRDDFYFRISVISLVVPPLRERSDDIPLLVDSFIKKFNREMGVDIKGVSSSAMTMLQSYHWPGNVRELENCVERAFNYATSSLLKNSDFGLTMDKETEERTTLSLRAARESAERMAIVLALRQAGGNKKTAADLLEIDRSLLYDKLKRYNIEEKEYTNTET